MLEKIFGKKSTGVVYIVCAGFLLLSLAGAVALYFTREGGSLFTLVGYAAYTAIELVLISLPVFVQKKWRLYIPPAIEIGICLYAVLFLTGNLYYDPRTDIQVSVTPFVGGFVFAMTVFSILYSVSSLRAEKKSRNPSPLRVSVLTFFATELVVVVFYLSVYLVALAVRAVTPGDITKFLAYSTAHQGGNLVFCVIGYFTARSRRAERYKIRSFKNTDTAELDALKAKNKTQYTVIKNISEDDTDYRKLMRRARANFLFGRIVYLVVYAAYLVHTCITFASRGSLGVLIIVFLAAGFVLTALVYVYEYYLFRKGAPNQRLRRLKIGKAAVRVYSLLLIITASFAADSGGEPLSSLFSAIMASFNLCVLFYNLFGKPRKYPSAKKAAQTAESEDTEEDPLLPLQEAEGGAPSPSSQEGDAGDDSIGDTDDANSASCDDAGDGSGDAP